ncbi:MAG TPA: 50S ribosomal protein L29 [Firmicutes bacterium]|nr:50S ribosomal protein L29 [Candidatus Fermentithermobacillaceae bacterium]
MKVQEIRNLNDKDLEKRLNDLKEELFNLRFQMTTGQLDNVMRLREVKRSIARVKTVQRQRELMKLAQEV